MNEPVADEQLRKSLQALGFTDYEARAYIALTEASPATAYEIAQRSGIPRANAYTVIGSLASKGAVQEVMRKPAKYVPVDPGEFFGRRARETSELCTEVAQAIKTRKQPDSNVYVWAYHGQDAVTSQIEEMMGAAQRHIWIKAPTEMIQGHLPRLIEAAERGVSIILIVFGDDETPLRVHPAFTVFLHEGRGTHRGASGVVFTMTVDSESFIIASFTDQVNASFASNPSLVYVVETMILHEIYIAEMYQKIGPALDSMFGEHLGHLRAKYRPSDMGQALSRASDSLSHSADSVGP